MMDAFTERDVNEVTIMAGTQLGKTEVLNNVVGYFIGHDPSPIMVVQPTLPMAMYWSKKRLSPMLRDTPELSCLISEFRSKAKDSSNTILEKDFIGGDINVAGANSPSSLASRPRRIVLFDEVNKYPASAGAEGDPISLGEERVSNYWNSVVAKTSTPGIKGVCRIEHSFEQSDKRFYFVPCPNCHEMITLKFGGKDAGFGLMWDEGLPESAYYVCQECAGICYESDKPRMLTLGNWVATAKFTGHAGFHINKLYSPWVPWPQIIADFLEKKKLPETLKVFINSTLAETWEEAGDQVEEEPLLARREHYGPEIPAGVLVVTAGVDVQDDRIEITFQGFGLEKEKWMLDHIVLPIDIARVELWGEIDQQLDRTFQTEDGVTLRVASAMIDSGGHRTQAVYDYVKPREIRRIFAIKGISKAGHPIVKRPKAKNKAGITLHMVGADQGKELIYSHLRIAEPGPGYCHFPFNGVASDEPVDREYFLGLTAEKCVTRFGKGFPIREWIKVRKRNEPLDCLVYAVAAFYNLNANMEAIAGKREKAPEKESGGEGSVDKDKKNEEQDIKPKPKRKPRKKKSNWMNSWKN